MKPPPTRKRSFPSRHAGGFGKTLIAILLLAIDTVADRAVLAIQQSRGECRIFNLPGACVPGGAVPGDFFKEMS